MFRCTLRAASLSVLLASALPAAALEVDAGDYKALPPGTRLLLLHTQLADRDTLYAAGQRLPGEGGLKTEIGIFRLARYAEIAGNTAVFQLVVPLGTARAVGAYQAFGKSHGFADPTLAATLWLVNAPQTGDYFGLSWYVQPPWGEYRADRVVNLGQNRWRNVAQVGWGTQLATGGPSLELVADVTAYGKNTECAAACGSASNKTQTTAPTTEWQAHLRHHLAPHWTVSMTLGQVTGGENEVDGRRLGDRLQTRYLRLGSGYFFDPRTQLLAVYGRDLSVRNGFKEGQRLNLRLLRAF
jgi:hypothetical protein